MEDIRFWVSLHPAHSVILYIRLGEGGESGLEDRAGATGCVPLFSLPGDGRPERSRKATPPSVGVVLVGHVARAGVSVCSILAMDADRVSDPGWVIPSLECVLFRAEPLLLDLACGISIAPMVSGSLHPVEAFGERQDDRSQI